MEFNSSFNMDQIGHLINDYNTQTTEENKTKSLEKIGHLLENIFKEKTSQDTNRIIKNQLKQVKVQENDVKLWSRIVQFVEDHSESKEYPDLTFQEMSGEVIDAIGKQLPQESDRLALKLTSKHLNDSVELELKQLNDKINELKEKIENNKQNPNPDFDGVKASSQLMDLIDEYNKLKGNSAQGFEKLKNKEQAAINLYKLFGGKSNFEQIPILNLYDIPDLSGNFGERLNKIKLDHLTAPIMKGYYFNSLATIPDFFIVRLENDQGERGFVIFNRENPFKMGWDLDRSSNIHFVFEDDKGQYTNTDNIDMHAVESKGLRFTCLFGMVGTRLMKDNGEYAPSNATDPKDPGIKDQLESLLKGKTVKGYKLA